MDKRRILIIDDEPDVVGDAVAALEKSGFKVHLALDQAQGLRELKKFKPDVVLLDLVLPGISGYKIAQSIRAQEIYKNIPIIAISFKREEIDKHIAAMSGIAGYIEKPIDIARLIFCVNETLKE